VSSFFIIYISDGRGPGNVVSHSDVGDETACGHPQTYVAGAAREEGSHLSLRGHHWQFRNADATVENKASSKAVAEGRLLWEADHFDREQRKERLSVRA